MTADPTGSRAAPDYSGNSMNHARDLGELRGSTHIGERVGQADLDDYFRFDVHDGGTFNLSLAGLNADADLELRSASGSILAQSKAGGRAPEQISMNLGAGTYYIRVFSFAGGNTSYGLSVNRT
jgi:hypothetical protein